MALANYCVPFYKPGGDLTGIATAAVTGKRFLNASATRSPAPALGTSTTGGNIRVAHAASGGHVIGVAEHDAASGAHVGILATPGMILPVRASGSIAAGAAVEVGTDGTATVLAAGTKVGVAVSGAADGEDAQIRLV